VSEVFWVLAWLIALLLPVITARCAWQPVVLVLL
jgi:hypothetical protein